VTYRVHLTLHRRPVRAGTRFSRSRLVKARELRNHPVDPGCREDAPSERVHVAVGGIALPNEASMALHRKFGFTEVGAFRERDRERAAR
jgi:hypothetical protein